MSNKNKTILESSPKNHYTWLMMGDYYFANSLMITNSILSNWNYLSGDVGKGEASDEISRQTFGIGLFNDDAMIFPAIYSLKHGSELHIKALLVNYENEYPQRHDIKELLDKLKNKYEGQETSLQALNRIWEILKKYYYGTYCPEVESRCFPDIQNEAERYPHDVEGKHYEIPEFILRKENSASSQIEYVHWVTNPLVASLKADVLCLHKDFRFLLRQLKPNEQYIY